MLFILKMKLKRKNGSAKAASKEAIGAFGRTRGFTLIEMLVAVGLFSVVMLISVAVILSIINGNRKSQSINTVVNNLNFSIESMIRDIKTGYWYQCYDYQRAYDLSDLDTFKQNYFNQNPSVDVSNGTTYSCTAGTQPTHYIAFVSTLSGTPRIVEYFYQSADANGPGRISKAYYQPAIGNESGGIVRSRLTTPEVDIQQMDFYTNNPPPAATIDKSNAKQPNVFLLIKGTTKINDKDVSPFGLQTFISQRLLNI